MLLLAGLFGWMFYRQHKMGAAQRADKFDFNADATGATQEQPLASSDSATYTQRKSPLDEL